MPEDHDFNRIRKIKEALAHVGPEYSRLAAEVERTVRLDRKVYAFIRSQGWRKLEPEHLPRVLKAHPEALDSSRVREELRSLRSASVTQQTLGEALGLKGPARVGPLGSALYRQENHAAKVLSECAAEIARPLERRGPKPSRGEIAEEIRNRLALRVASGCSKKEAHAKEAKLLGFPPGESLRDWLRGSTVLGEKSK